MACWSSCGMLPWPLRYLRPIANCAPACPRSAASRYIAMATSSSSTSSSVCLDSSAPNIWCGPASPPSACASACALRISASLALLTGSPGLCPGTALAPALAPALRASSPPALSRKPPSLALACSPGPPPPACPAANASNTVFPRSWLGASCEGGGRGGGLGGGQHRSHGAQQMAAQPERGLCFRTMYFSGSNLPFMPLRPLNFHAIHPMSTSSITLRFTCICL
mmetsp:Transcript_67415/g.152576  ORF Transcript_67415/g.152576 Transcript_67415/m.152576 type:complete len:224 (+) Transcript_67415:1029-1700(+)